MSEINIAKTRLLDLYKIALADGKIEPNEYQLLFDISQSLGLNENDVLDVINGESNFDLEKPSTFQDRMQHLFQMLFLMKIDGEINTKEISTIKSIALHLGLDILMTNELVDIISQYKNGLVPQEKMIEEVKRHMN